MKNKWASCSTNGNLNFNTELLGLDRDVGEYVIVHELLHFVVPHHGKLWKSLMRVHLGDYERLDFKLNSSVAKPKSVRPASLKNTLIRTNTMKVRSDGQ